jgi:hypothetical protein
MGVRYEVPEGKTATIEGPCSIEVVGDPGKVPQIGDTAPPEPPPESPPEVR